MKTFKHLREKLTQGDAPEWKAITTDEDGFSVAGERLEWSSIKSIAAFKRDLLTFDDVWFRLEGPGAPILICEEQPGFSNWEAQLCKCFPVVANWREYVIQPAFSANYTVLYSRA